MKDQLFSWTLLNGLSLLYKLYLWMAFDFKSNLATGLLKDVATWSSFRNVLNVNACHRSNRNIINIVSFFTKLNQMPRCLAKSFNFVWWRTVPWRFHKLGIFSCHCGNKASTCCLTCKHDGIHIVSDHYNACLVSHKWSESKCIVVNFNFNTYSLIKEMRKHENKTVKACQNWENQCFQIYPLNWKRAYFSVHWKTTIHSFF